MTSKSRDGRTGLAAPGRAAGQTRRGQRPYATGLDGIRAIAVVCVVLYHAGVPGFRGGFVGVDLFFVLSGYLVTALMQREHDLTGRLDVPAFFRRRATRLLPALGFMLVVVCAATLMLGRDLGAGLRSQLLGAFTFSSNWVQISTGSSYVDRAEPAVLTHLWSLAVEEQFYLLWPAIALLLLGAVGARHRRVGLVLAAALASGALMATTFSSGMDPTRVYVGTDTHGFGLLLGAALALGRPSSDVDPVRRTRPIAPTGLACSAGPIALLTVLTGVAVLTDSSPLTFRGGLFGIDIAAVVLVAVTVRGAGPVARLLGHRALRWWGLRSYALYLWHWPALVIADRTLSAIVGRTASAAIAIGVAVVAAEVSWRIVEQPVRRWGVAGYLASIRVTLLGGPVRVRRRSAGWAAAGSFALVLALAACSVVAAPRESELAVSLAAGEQAIAAAGHSTDPDPSPRTAPAVSHRQSSSVAAPVMNGLPTSSTTTTSTSTSTTTTNSGSTSTTSSTSTSRSPGKPLMTPSLPPSTNPRSPQHTTAAPPPSRAVRRPVTVAVRAPPEVPAITGGDLSAIGDSVMLASAPALLARFPGADLDAVVGRQLWDLGSVIAPKIAEGTLRRDLVVGLGTNGTDSAGHIEAALTQVPASTVVVLVNSYVPDGWQDVANTSLATAAASRPHTCVADWHGAISARPGLLGADGIHPSGPGGELYASVITDALSRCR